MLPEADFLCFAIRTEDEQFRGTAVTTDHLRILAREIFQLYGAVYNRQGRNINIHVLPPLESSRTYFNDNFDINIPRGYYTRAVELRVESLQPTARIVGADFKDEVIYLLFGDSSLIHASNHRGVFRHILGHEFVHGQVVPQAIVGVNPPPLLPQEIDFGDDIHYVTGFKAAYFDFRRNTFLYPTKNLDEYATQFIYMNIVGFDQEDEVLDAMKSRDRGISAHFIKGAETLRVIFEDVGISAQQIELLHYHSDIRGFINLLNESRPYLGRKIIHACSQPKADTGLKMLQDA